ncbi:MAG TPA: hypothetical protein VFX43_00370, partial [Chitinophagaceae bacterium]|nr:hypothetical protein [Chitinophagaceae bacterium]
AIDYIQLQVNRMSSDSGLRRFEDHSVSHKMQARYIKVGMTAGIEAMASVGKISMIGTPVL